MSRKNLSQDIAHIIEDGKLIRKDEVSFFAFKNKKGGIREKESRKKLVTLKKRKRAKSEILEKERQ